MTGPRAADPYGLEPYRASRAALTPTRLGPPPHAWLVDCGVTLLLGCLLALPMASSGGAVFATSILTVMALIPRSNLPRVSLVMGTVACLIQVALVDTPSLSIIVVPVIIYSVARWSTQFTARVALGVGVVGSVIGPVRWLVPMYAGTPDVRIAFPLAISVFGCLGMIAAAYALGRRRRDTVMSRALREQAYAERVRHEAAEREQRTRMSAVSERQRIARELHDIVAHSLSVIVVQAEGGKALAAKRPQVAPEVLETIADTGRDALVEMRRIVALLRGEEQRGEDEDTYVPSPGLDDLDALVRKTGNATLTVRGALPSVSTALGLTVYRVVQESLTNVLKHGGPGARAEVVLTTHPDRIEVIITDDGRGAASESDGQGNGLRGMHERLAVHRGVMAARPRAGGGFEVRATIPLEHGIAIHRTAPAPIPAERRDYDPGTGATVSLPTQELRPS